MRYKNPPAMRTTILLSIIKVKNRLLFISQFLLLFLSVAMMVNMALADPMNRNDTASVSETSHLYSNNLYIFPDTTSYKIHQIIKQRSTAGTLTDRDITNSIMIYPNPTFGNLFVDCNFKELRNLEISIYDMMGYKLHEVYIPEAMQEKYVLDMSLLEAGNYIIQIHSDRLDVMIEIELIN